MTTSHVGLMLRHSRGALRLASVAILLAATAPTPLDAQFAYAVDSARERCLDALPTAGMRRVDVFVVPTIGDRNQRRVVPQVALMLQSVLEAMRAKAGLPEDALPVADPTITWRELDGDLLVIAHRDGRLQWRVDNRTFGVARGNAAAAWLDRALAAAREAQALFFAWPDDVPGDSALVRVAFQRPYVDGAGALQPLRADTPVPAFTLAVPLETPVAIDRAPYIRYPSSQTGRREPIRIVMQFVVDTGGRVVKGTLRELLPDGMMRNPAASEPGFSEFLSSIRDGLLGARFIPARVGTCRVPMLVQQPFEFGVR